MVGVRDELGSEGRREALVVHLHEALEVLRENTVKDRALGVSWPVRAGACRSHLPSEERRWSSATRLPDGLLNRVRGRGRPAGRRPNPRDATRESCADRPTTPPLSRRRSRRRCAAWCSSPARRRSEGGVTSFHDADGFQVSTLGIGDRANREADHDHRNTQPGLRSSGPARPVGLRRRSLCAAPP